MDDNGWFVTGLMYLKMILGIVIARPLSLFVKLVERYPRYTLNVVLAIGGAACLYHAIHHQGGAPLYTWLGIGMLLLAVIMVFFLRDQPAPRKTVRVASNRDNWFHD